jgi:hypothetical protein
MEVIAEATPVKDARDVSKVLKSSTIFDSPVRENALATIPTTPSSLPPLPPSPERSILSRIPQPSALIQSVQAIKTHEITSTVKDSWISLRIVGCLPLLSCLSFTNHHAVFIQLAQSLVVDCSTRILVYYRHCHPVATRRGTNWPLFPLPVFLTIFNSILDAYCPSDTLHWLLSKPRHSGLYFFTGSFRPISSQLS